MIGDRKDIWAKTKMVIRNGQSAKGYLLPTLRPNEEISATTRAFIRLQNRICRSVGGTTYGEQGSTHSTNFWVILIILESAHSQPKTNR